MRIPNFRKNYIDDLRLQLGTKVISLEDSIPDLWVPVYHRRFGLCYMLDMSRSEDYSFVDVEDEKPKIRMNMTNDNPWEWGIILLHTKNDSADSRQVIINNYSGL